MANFHDQELNEWAREHHLTPATVNTLLKDGFNSLPILSFLKEEDIDEGVNKAQKRLLLNAVASLQKQLTPARTTSSSKESSSRQMLQKFAVGMTDTGFELIDQHGDPSFAGIAEGSFSVASQSFELNNESHECFQPYQGTQLMTSSAPNATDVRCVLLGRSGNGKSATGNTLLGSQDFHSGVSANSGTRQCSLSSRSIDNKELVLVDCPGIFAPNLPEQQVLNELAQVIGLASPGPHAFILILNCNRFTNEEEESLGKLQTIFGENFCDFLILIFTHLDDLEFDKSNLDTYIRDSPKLQELVSKCRGRYLGINNREKNPAYGVGKARELLEMVESLQQRNKQEYFSNSMFREAARIMQETEQRRRLIIEREKREKEEQIQQECEARINAIKHDEMKLRQKLEQDEKLRLREEEELKQELIRFQQEKQQENDEVYQKLLKDLEDRASKIVRAKEAQKRFEEESNQTMAKMLEEMGNIKLEQQRALDDQRKIYEEEIRNIRVNSTRTTRKPAIPSFFAEIIHNVMPFVQKFNPFKKL